MAKFSFKKAFSGKGKQGLIIVLALLLIGGAVYLNVAHLGDDIGYGDNNMTDAGADEGEGTGGTVDAGTYFSAAQTSRTQAREEALAVLQAVIESEDAKESAKDEALSEMAAIAADIQSEANIESLVLAKGFENCVAVLSGDKVNVIVKAETLTAAEVAQINEIVYEAAGILPTHVKILCKS